MSAYDSSFLYFNHYWYLLLEIESITNIPNMALTHKENGAAINEEVDTTAVHDRRMCDIVPSKTILLLFILA